MYFKQRCRYYITIGIKPAMPHHWPTLIPRLVVAPEGGVEEAFQEGLPARHRNGDERRTTSNQLRIVYLPTAVDSALVVHRSF